MESYKENRIEINSENLNLPEDTFVLIEETQQFGYFERPANPGFSRIKNIGVVKNTAFRKPTDDELWFYTDEHNILEGSEEYNDLIRKVGGWDRVNENSSSHKINGLIDQYIELKSAISFARSRVELPENQLEFLKQDEQKLIVLTENIKELKTDNKRSFSEETLYQKVPL
ncbi:hypothetical protein GW765_04125 [Candidatus Parcubacteria bacterium]|nr:hypothetical protein [Candidatus Parcubacteria bacterium]